MELHTNHKRVQRTSKRSNTDKILLQEKQTLLKTEYNFPKITLYMYSKAPGLCTLFGNGRLTSFVIIVYQREGRKNCLKSGLYK